MTLPDPAGNPDGRDPAPPGPVPPDGRRLTPFALAVYLPMIGIGLLAAPEGTFSVRNADALGRGLLVALAGVVVVVAGSRWVSRHTGWGRALHAEFHAIVAGLPLRTLLWLALLSAVGEEFLFRGVLHPWLGLWPTAVVFALMHFPLRRSLRPWTAFAFGMGVALGLLVDASQSLWPAVLLHYGINQLNLMDLARGGLGEGEGSERGNGGPPTDAAAR